MSALEKNIHSELTKIFGLNNVIYQKEIYNCPFTSSNKHKVDFFIKNYDLYIEVKGSMTLYETNVLEYLLKYREERFCIIQGTCEDWIRPYVKSRDKSAKNKNTQNLAQQLQELNDLKNNKLSTKVLQTLSIQRLNKFRRLRARDIRKWRQRSPI